MMIPSVRTAATAVLVCALAASACGKKPPEVKPMPPPPPPAEKPTTPPPPPSPTPPPPPVTAPDKPLTEDEIFAKATPDDLTKSGVLKPVYFDYDSIVLTEGQRLARRSSRAEHFNVFRPSAVRHRAWRVAGGTIWPLRSE